MTPNRAARRPPGHARHAAWRPRSADDGLSGVAFESDTDGARVTGSRCIRPAHVDRHRKGDEKGATPPVTASFTGRLRIVRSPLAGVDRPTRLSS